jgi:isoamylase
MFSRGVPMVVGGDEYGRTQNGNNNPYKLDSVATWHNYAAIATPCPTRVPTEGPGKYHDNFGCYPKPYNGWFRFFRQVLQLRANHGALRQSRYGDFNPDSGHDVTMCFVAPDGNPTLWHPRALQWQIDGLPVNDTNFVLFVNMSANDVAFTLPAAMSRRPWRRLIDTAAWAEVHDNYWSPSTAQTFTAYDTYDVHAFSVVVFDLG